MVQHLIPGVLAYYSLQHRLCNLVLKSKLSMVSHSVPLDGVASTCLCLV